MTTRINDVDDICSVTVLHRPGTPVRKPALDIACYLTVVDGSETGKKVELGLKPVNVGRRPDNDLPLTDPFVSGYHCTISFEAGVVWVNDLKSTNGSFIDGVRVNGRAAWPDGASLQVGNQLLRHEYLARSEIERSARLDVDLEDAAGYVRSLLPPVLRSGAITTAWHSAPSAALGGDIFHYHWLDEHHFAVYLIDVCGHGIGAALHSVSVSNLLRQKSLHTADFTRPASVLQALNAALPMERYGSMYFTLWYGVYRPVDRQLSYASAGHPPALLFTDSGRRRLDLATDNPPIGVVEGVEYVAASTTLGANASLFLYSDGVFEIVKKDGSWWSCEEFATYLQQRVGHDDVAPDRIFHDIRALVQGEQFQDDFTLLLLRV